MGLPRKSILITAVLLVVVTAITAVFFFLKPTPPPSLQEQFELALDSLNSGSADNVSDTIAALRGDPAFADSAKLLEAVLFLKANRLESALRTLAELDQEGPLRHQILLAAGEALNRLQRFGEAERALSVLVQEQPDNVDAHRWLGATYYDLGAFDGAIAEFSRVVKLAPQDYRPHHILGVMYSDFEQHGDAIREFTTALELDPFPEVAEQIRIDLAQAHVALHEYDKALEQLKLCNRSGRTQRLLASCLLNTGKLEEAQKAVADARSLGEKSAALALLESEMLDQQNDSTKAAELLQQAISDFPAEAELYYQLGLILQKLGRTEEASARMKEWEGYRDLSTQLTQLNLKAVADTRDAALRDQLADICEKLHKPELAAMWRAAAESCRRAQAAETQK